MRGVTRGQVEPDPKPITNSVQVEGKKMVCSANCEVLVLLAVCRLGIHKSTATERTNLVVTRISTVLENVNALMVPMLSGTCIESQNIILDGRT